MIIGSFINAGAILIGGLIGSLLSKKMPERLRLSLPKIIGLTTIGLGVTLINDVENLSVMALSIIIGSAIGEFFLLEEKIEKFSNLSTKSSNILKDGSADMVNYTTSEKTRKLVAIIVLFCAGVTGIIGSMTEGMLNDPSILLVKSVMDIFTATIFASELGYIVMVIAIPQLIIQLSFVYLSVFIMPYASTAMINDFTAVGGIILLATGLRVSETKFFSIANMLPSLVLAMPISYIWTLTFN